MPPIANVAVEDGGRSLRVAWAEGDASRFHALWLRDNCQDPASRDPRNGQRLFTILDVPPDLRVARAEAGGGDVLEVVFAPGGYATRFAAGWLRARRYDGGGGGGREAGWLAPGLETWGRELAERLPSLPYPEIAGDERALLRWLDLVARHGFAVATGAPRLPGTVTAAAELFGYVRETNYGRLFDVRSEPDPINLAYTAMGLQVHTDNPYRDPVPGLQLLHCLADASEGGDSLVVDGFAAALALKAEAPEAFDLLTRRPARFAYADARTRLEAKAPMIGLGADGELVEVRFNNRSLAGVEVPGDEMDAFYAAYRAFAAILERPALEVTFKLAPGDLFIVDNRRVLHGRKAFAGGGRRHLQGCYADRDGLMSTRATLRRRLEGEG
jgi:[2-(trimethylamino)ethyl]phosphonate dioxygenase